MILGASDFPSINAESQVADAALKAAGMDVDYEAMDWGTVTQRRTNKGPPDKGGWSAFFTAAAGLEMFDPTGHNQIRGNGPNAWFGWPSSPKLEELRDAWFAAPDLAQQKDLRRDAEAGGAGRAVHPARHVFQPTAYSRSLSGILKGGFAMFHNVSRS